MLELQPGPGTWHASFSRDHEPVATVEPGETFRVRSLDANGYLSAPSRPGEQGPTAFPGETPTERITFGFDADLNAATVAALDAMLTWMQPLLGVDRATALALASIGVDLRVTQIANGTWGVHATLPRDRLRR